MGKALRNFCNVLFKNEHEEEEVTPNGQTVAGNAVSPQSRTIGNAAPPPPYQEEEVKVKSNGTTKSSLFNTLRSKLPQRTPKSNGNLFNNLSPSNFMNKRNSPQSSASPKQPKECPEDQQAPEPEQ